MEGFFAAHAVWCIYEGETLIPFVGSSAPGGSRSLVRLAGDLQAAVAAGRARIEQNPTGATGSVLIYDGYFTHQGERLDSLFVDAREYAPEPLSFMFALAYQHARSAGGFKVYRPKIVSLEPSSTSLESLVKGFFSGVGQHEKGADVWNRSLDESK